MDSLRQKQYTSGMLNAACHYLNLKGELTHLLVLIGL